MKQLLLTSTVIFMSYAAGAAAQPAEGAGPEPAMVEWIVPALPSNRPQTDAEAELGKQQGRPAPPPELLQPTIDPALPSYHARTDMAIKGSFHGAASDVLAKLSKLWADEFHKLYPDAEITISPPYAGSLGAKELVNGKLDFVFVSRELKPDDITDFTAKYGYDPTSIPVSGGTYRQFGFLDSVGFIVNKDNPLEKISFDQLDGILSRNHARGGPPITEWGQLGLTGEWAHAPIHAYGIKPWNGFEEFIRQRVLSRPGVRGEWRDDMNYAKVVFPIAKSVAGDKFGIGYDGLAYIDAPVKVLPVSETNVGPAVAPTYENVALADYPLSRITFFNTNKASGKKLDPVLEEFVRFIRSREGQQVVLSQGIFLPLRDKQVRATDSLLQ